MPIANAPNTEANPTACWSLRMAIDTTRGGARLRRSISRPNQSDRHRRDERRHNGTQTRALCDKKRDGACGTTERRSHRRGPFGIAGQGVGRGACRAECNTCRQLSQRGRRICANGDERRTEAVGECSTKATPAIVAPVIMTNSKNRPAAVTGAPVMTSPTEPTSERPARSTTRPAAIATQCLWCFRSHRQSRARFIPTRNSRVRRGSSARWRCRCTSRRTAHCRS